MKYEIKISADVLEKFIKIDCCWLGEISFK